MQDAPFKSDFAILDDGTSIEFSGDVLSVKQFRA